MFEPFTVQIFIGRTSLRRVRAWHRICRVGTLPAEPMHAAATPAALDARAPVVVVGAGPVGVRFVQLLHERDPSCPIVLYGREPWQPYNRVQLSSFLRGGTAWEALLQGLELPCAPHVQARLHCEVLSIDRAGRCVRDSQGRTQPYATLVLATGSRARVPDLPGIGQANVFVFRDLADAQALLARRARSVHTVVLGGGLLGLEAARAMQRLNTRVTVLEHAPRLLARQLDERTSACLSARLLALGLTLRTDAAVRALRGHGRVTGIELRGGERIDCDTVIVATGIVPNTALALQAGIAVGRGVRVDDRMGSSDPHVLAIGECAEHRGEVHGLVAPGLEQAAVAVHTALGGSARYDGSLVSTRLKVAGVPVCSIGVVDAQLAREPLRVLSRALAPDGQLTLALARGRLVGVAAVGEVPQLDRLHEAVLARRRVWPWQRLRWRLGGRLWPEGAARSVCDWPAQALVCQCNQVTRGTLDAALARGCSSVAALGAATRAGTVCGTCKPLLGELLAGRGQAPAPAEPVRAWRTLGSGATLAATLALLLLALPGWAYWHTVQDAPVWQRVWTEPLYKQVSGYTVMGLAALGLVLSLRKRVDAVRAGAFDWWRLLHVALGALALMALAVHTGARLGARLDAALMLSFAGLSLVGAAAALVVAFEHRLRPAQVRAWRSLSAWTHILLSWPLPVLLGLHVLKAYWF